MRYNKKGFTLIELLIVIGIIAILAAGVIVTINPGRQFAQARDVTRNSHVTTLYNSLLSYQFSNQGNLNELSIPIEPTEICNTNLSTPTCTDLKDLSTLTAEGYISSIPVDPQGSVSETSDGTGYSILQIDGKVAIHSLNSETRVIRNGNWSFKDSRDDQIYKTVLIGDQVWMAEDLLYDNGCSGKAWDSSTPHDACGSQGVGYKGLLYQWDAAMDGSTTEGAQGLCPSGWHIPTDQEFTNLENWLSNNGYSGVEGDAVKDPAESWCNSSICGGIGFLALPGGYRYTVGDLYGVGTVGSWWTSSGDDTATWSRSLIDSNSNLSRFYDGQRFGNSVRCLRN